MRTPVLLDRQVGDVANQAARARVLLATRVRNSTITKSGQSCWGQWLDNARAHDQSGVYGTTAAIEILIANGSAPDQEPVESAIDGLPISGNGNQRKPQDELLVFKVAAIVEACGIAHGRLELTHSAVKRLIEMRADDNGWGGYCSEHSRDNTPAFEQTAVAMHALAHVPEWGVDPRCGQHLRWLSERLAAGSTDEVGDSLGLLALQKYRNVAGETTEWRNGVSAAQVRIVGRLKHQSDLSVERFHYSVNLDGPADKYMYFAPSIIGALALLSGEPGHSVPGGPEVIGLVRTLASNVERDRAFRTDKRISTVDQLWVDRLFAAFLAAARTPANLLRPVARIAFGGRRRWFTVPVGFVLASICAQVAAGDSVSFIPVLIGAFAGFLLNVLASQVGSQGPG